MAHVRADVESAAGPLFGGEPASLCGVPPVGDLGQRVAGICVCHFQPPPAVSRSRRQGQRTMPGDVASTKKGAEHAKSPRNDDRGFSVAARARGLDSSAPAQRGWGLRAAGPIIHPSTAGARTRTRQVGITGHRNGSTGWRKIQRKIQKGWRKIQQGVFRPPPRCGRFPTPKRPNTPFRPVAGWQRGRLVLTSPRRPHRTVFVANPAEVCASVGRIGRLTDPGRGGRRNSSGHVGGSYLRPLASDVGKPSCKVTNLGIEQGQKPPDENRNRADVRSPCSTWFT